jgi:hypothetical protein
MTRKRFNQQTKQIKAQLEMIGLVIIVIIVITALLIFLVYQLSHPTKDLKKTYMNRQIATNMLISMKEANVQECPDYKLKDLIIDCAKPSPSLICYDQTSCYAANKTIAEMLDKTLVNWSVSFNFSVISPFKEESFLSFINLNCSSNSREKVEGWEILPLFPISASAEMKLGICLK